MSLPGDVTVVTSFGLFIVVVGVVVVVVVVFGGGDGDARDEVAPVVAVTGAATVLVAPSSLGPIFRCLLVLVGW